MEHGLPVGETGIKVVKIGPWVIGDEVNEDWQFSYLPIPTKQCDTCAKRRGMGKVPTCVQHCQSKCLDSSEVQKTIDAVTGATWGTRNRIMAGLFQRDLRKHGDDMPAFAPPRRRGFKIASLVRRDACQAPVRLPRKTITCSLC